MTVADGPAPVDAVIDANVSGTGGLVKAGPGLLRLNGGSPYTGATLVAAGTLEVLGSLGRSSVTLAGGTLGGEGGLGSLTVTGGTVAPSLGVASAPGTLNVEALVFGAGVFAPQISGDFHDPADRLQVIGPVTLTGVVLTPTRTGPPLDVGDPFYILTNDSDDAVVGTFSGLPQGATLTVNGQLFAVSYADGDGNDVALRALTNPTPPVPVVPVVPPVIPPVTPPVTPKPALVGVPLFAAGTDAGTVGTATLYNADKSVRITVTPFGDFSGGVRVAAADFNGDGVADLAVGTGPGRATQVVVLDGVTQKVLFTIDPFEATFTGGVNVTAGDVTGDGLADLVITPDQGGGPRGRVFAGNTTAAAFAQYADFFGIDDKAFFGGARAGVADLDGDGVGDLIVSAGFGGGPRVAGYNGLTLGLVTPVKLFGDFLAFEADLRNGAFVTGGDLDGDGRAELIAGGGPGGGPRVTAFSGAVLLANQQLPLVNFFAGDVDSRGGVRVTVKNLDGDASADLVVGAGTAAGSRVTAYAGKSLGAVTPPELFAFDALAGFAGGVFVG